MSCNEGLNTLTGQLAKRKETTMTNVVAVFDGFGSLLTIIRADTKHQLSCALDDFADEYVEGCALQEPITDRDWDTIVNAFEGSCISILCDISGDNELEIKGVPLRDYTHYPPNANEIKGE